MPRTKDGFVAGRHEVLGIDVYAARLICTVQIWLPVK